MFNSHGMEDLRAKAERWLGNLENSYQIYFKAKVKQSCEDVVYVM